MDNIMFKGILPALVTPLNDDSTIRVKSVEPLVKWQLSRGVDGFYVLGASGEGAVLAEAERMKMAEATADAMKGTGKKLILHVGDSNTRSAQRLAKHAREIGADAISSVYPNFFETYSVPEAMDYYRSLVDISGLPMICYCTAMLRDLDPVQFVGKLMTIDGVIGVKYTFPNYYNMQRIKLLNNGNINVINGPDETLICGLVMGADGGIGCNYNLIPEKFVALYNYFIHDDLKGACDAQEDINKLIRLILQYPLIPAIKCILDYMGFDVGYAAFPGTRLSQETQRELISALRPYLSID